MRKRLIIFSLIFIIATVAVAVVVWSLGRAPRPPSRTFPRGFLFGVASASYQIEGAWNEDGKSESVWDRLVHTEPCAIVDCSNGDDASNSYHLYKRDVEMLRELGVDFYRFSLSWPRLLPAAGRSVRVNAAAVDFYNSYINEMIKYNITPVVTLFHWDYPQHLEEMGGWTSPHAADWFADYARAAFRLFGDRVKSWITINEPEYFCYFAYKSILAKQFGLYENITRGVTGSECSKIMLMAHAKVWHVYDQEYRPSQGGNISIAISSMWYEPDGINNRDDVEAAEDMYHVNFGYYADPIFSKNGIFPTWPTPVRRAASANATRGYAIGRLPQFNDQEKAFLRGTSDYLGINHYSTRYISKKGLPRAYNVTPTYFKDLDVWWYHLPEWNIGTSDLIKCVPWGFYKLLTRVQRDYDNPPVFVFENGFSTDTGLHDEARVTYLRGYMAAMLDAIEGGADIRGYTVWALMDSFEWKEGYRSRFGLYEVSRDSHSTRRPRDSARFYRHVVQARALLPEP